MKINSNLEIPENIQAVLWDMDGVLVDTLSACYTLVHKIITKHFSSEINLSNEFIKSKFSLDLPEFFEAIMEEVYNNYSVEKKENIVNLLVEDYSKFRGEIKFPLNTNIKEVLTFFQKHSIKQAVVSNSDETLVKKVIENSKINTYFDLVIGNNPEGKILAKKPEPDIYHYAANSLGVDISNCLVIEDSFIGATAGVSSGATTLAVCTGGGTSEELSSIDGIYKIIESF